MSRGRDGGRGSDPRARERERLERERMPRVGFDYDRRASDRGPFERRRAMDEARPAIAMYPPHHSPFMPGGPPLPLPPPPFPAPLPYQVPPHPLSSPPFVPAIPHIGFPPLALSATSPSSALLSYGDWLAFHALDPTMPGLDSRYARYKAEVVGRSRRAFYDKHKDDEWMREQFAFKATADALRERSRAKALRREQLMRDLEDGNTGHLHLLDDTSSAPPPSSSFVDHTLVVQSSPPRITRAALLPAVSALDGFRLLSLSMATAKSLQHRIAFVVMSSLAACQEAVAKLHGTRAGSWELKVRGSIKEVARKDVAAGSRSEARVIDDEQRSRRLIQRLDEEEGWEQRDVVDPSPAAPHDARLQRLNTHVAYLRWVHCYCYYCAREFHDPDELLASCGMVHRRRTKAADHDADELDTLARRAEERARGTGALNAVDAAVMDQLRAEQLHRHMEHKAEGKWKCALCAKLFKGEEFLLKHLRLRHEAETAEAERRAEDEWQWKRYCDDDHAPTEDRDKRENNGRGGRGDGYGSPVVTFPFRPGQPLSAMTTMPFVPALHAEEPRRRSAGAARMVIEQPAPLYSLPPISITPSSLGPQPSGIAPLAPANSASLRGLTSYADLDVPDAPPPLPEHGLLLTPVDKAAQHYGAVKGKWQPKAKAKKADAGQPVAPTDEQKTAPIAMEG